MDRQLGVLRSVALGLLFITAASAEECGFSKDKFRNPPPEFSPSFFWLWGGTLAKDGVLAAFDDMAAHGARTACIRPYPKAFRWFVESPMVPDYLTDGYFDLYGEVLDHIERAGGRSWLYDEGGWPSGSACGRVVASDPERFQPRYVTAGGAVESDMGDPKWGALCPSLIERGATERFIELGYEPYRKRFSRHFGKTVRFAFTDEPGYPNVRKGGRLPWCTDFADEFRSRKHYDIQPFVDNLIAPSNCTEEVARTRIDYYDVLSSLLCERYFLKVRDWCRANNLGFGGHLNGEDDPIYNAEGNYGHALRCLRAMDVPGVDVIWRQLFPGKNGRQMPFTKYASSAAHQTGGRYVLSETCAIYGDGLTPTQMKWLADYQLLRGVNLFVFSSYQPYPSRSMMGGGGPHFGPSDPQWDYMTTFFEMLSRQCAILAQGKPCVRTAVLYDIRGIWVGGDEAQKTIARHVAVARKLMEEQRDFDFVDDDQLADAVLCENGTIEIGKMRYAAVVLPTSRRMLPAARRKLADFVSRGGVLAEGDDFTSVPKTCAVEGERASDIRVAKRVCGEQALYFLVNENEEPRRVHIRLDETDPLIRADAETGRFVEWPSENGAFTWNAEGCGSILLVSGATFDDPAPQKPAGVEINLKDGWTMAVRRRMQVGPVAYETTDYPEAPLFATSLGDWRKKLGDEFCGRVLYRIVFDSPEAGGAELDLGEVHNCCAVRLNRHDIGARYVGPYRWRVRLVKGRNELEVTVANAIVNAVSPERVRNYIYSAFPPMSPYETRVKAFNGGGHDSGLYGPVRIRFVGHTTRPIR